MSTNHRILVTGARGFLGSHIVTRALADQHDVISAYRGASGTGTVSLEVCDSASVDEALRAVLPSIVIHCAAYGVNYADQDLNSALAVNVHGSLSMLTTAARHRVQRFVHVGSCFEYGSQAGRIIEDTMLSPSALYGASKAAATLLLKEHAHTLGISLVVARPFGIWGPGEAAYRLIPQVIAACLNRNSLKLTPCEVIRDLTYVEDMASRILELALLEAVSSGTIVNVGSGQGVVLRDFVLSIAKLLEGEDLMQFGALSYRPTEMPSLVADVRRMHQLLGDCPTTAVADGVLRVLASSRRGEKVTPDRVSVNTENSDRAVK